MINSGLTQMDDVGNIFDNLIDLGSVSLVPACNSAHRCFSISDIPHYLHKSCKINQNQGKKMFEPRERKHVCVTWVLLKKT